MIMHYVARRAQVTEGWRHLAIVDQPGRGDDLCHRGLAASRRPDSNPLMFGISLARGALGMNLGGVMIYAPTRGPGPAALTSRRHDPPGGRCPDPTATAAQNL
jgi:hypothetical protein